MRIDLPPLRGDRVPAFTDLAACREWIGRLPLLNPPHAQLQLLDQLCALNGTPLPAAVRLDMLEALQLPIRFVQHENASLFSGKPLPLAPLEQSAIDATHDVWQALLSGYLRCLEALLGGDAALAPRAALICQRALALLTDDYADLARAGQLADTPLWRFAHALYASAETLGVAQVAVADDVREAQAATGAAAETLSGFRPVTPAMAYVELVLIAAASLHELMPRQQQWVMRWARGWAGKVPVLKGAPELSAALPLCVDVEGDAPPGFRPQSGPGARWLDTTALRKSLKKRLVLLARGDPAVTPASLGLGEDCILPSGAEVLRRVYPRWVKGGVRRRYERHPMSGVCRFVAGVDAVHYYIAGHQPFRPPGSSSSDELRRQREELALYGRVGTHYDDQFSQNQGFQLENWTLVEDWGLFDQSEDGLCLTRPLDRDGGRLGVGQLVAVQLAGRSEMRLGVARWTQRRGDQLVAGIQLMAGRPQSVAVRRTGVMATPDKYRPGFVLLPTDPAHQPAMLVLPPGGFKAERVMEVWTQIATRRFKLKELVERGADFERATCVEQT